jgi:hypothetical protein
MSDGWLHIANPTEVELASLGDFAARVDGDQAAYTLSYDQGIAVLDGVINVFGLGGLAEGTSYGTAHANCLFAAQAFMMELGMGLTTLSGAAQAIAMEYGSADAFAAATTGSVTAAFTPFDLETVDLSPEARAQIEAAEAEARAAADAERASLEGAQQSDYAWAFGDAAGGGPQVFGQGPGAYVAGPDEQYVSLIPTHGMDQQAAEPVGDPDQTVNDAWQAGLDHRAREDQAYAEYLEALAQGAEQHE